MEDFESSLIEGVAGGGELRCPLSCRLRLTQMNIDLSQTIIRANLTKMRSFRDESRQDCDVFIIITLSKVTV